MHLIPLKANTASKFAALHILYAYEAEGKKVWSWLLPFPCFIFSWKKGFDKRPIGLPTKLNQQVDGDIRGHHTKGTKRPTYSYDHITIICSPEIQKIYMFLFFCKSLTLVCGHCGHAHTTLYPWIHRIVKINNVAIVPHNTVRIKGRLLLLRFSLQQICVLRWLV